MEKNVGSADAVIRVMLGMGLIVNIWAADTGLAASIILLVLGSILFFTAWTGFCGLYKPLGICTVEGCDCCKKEDAEASAE